MDNLILYDWLSFTTKENDPKYIISLLGLEHLEWLNIKGAHGYQDRLYSNFISIHYNGREDMGTWCELSGQGCRAYESMTTNANGWDELFQLINSENMNITRLDVAYDDHVGLLNIDTIISDTLNKEYVSRSEYWEVLVSSKGQTIQIGSSQSDVLIRIYNKAAERKREGEHWIRVELQLRHDRAKKFTELDLPIGQAFCGVVLNYLRYVDPDPTDSNRWRWPMKDYWGLLLCDAERITLYESPGIEYNLEKCKEFVINHAGNAIDAYLQIRGLMGFLQDLNTRKTARNPKYEKLINDYKSVNV